MFLNLSHENIENFKDSFSRIQFFQNLLQGRKVISSPLLICNLIHIIHAAFLQLLY